MSTAVVAGMHTLALHKGVSERSVHSTPSWAALRHALGTCAHAVHKPELHYLTQQRTLFQRILVHYSICYYHKISSKPILKNFNSYSLIF